MTVIALSRLHFPVTTLGPGRRVGLWFQGCSIRCPGCISPDTWASREGLTRVSELIRVIAGWVAEADGLTVSGGEPFDQPDALVAVLEGWRRVSNSDVLVFTGRRFEDVSRWLDAHPGLIDALVAGPFLRNEPQSLALRGSDNQTLYFLTEAGQSVFSPFERKASPNDRRLDLMIDADGGAWFAGIPARGDFERLQQALRAAGHRVILTDRGSST